MKILIVEARYHPDVADALVDGATAALDKGLATFERLSVPGVLEIPAAIAIAARSARPFDGYIALGAATGPGGALYHAETMRALTSIGAMGIALGQGVVLAADEGAARDLAISHDVGGDAARACLALATFGERQGAR